MPSLFLSFSPFPMALSFDHSNPGVRTVFGDRLKALGKDLEKQGSGIIGLVDDDEESAEED